MNNAMSIRQATAQDAGETAAVFSAVMNRRAFAPKLHTDEEDRAYIGERITEGDTWVAVVDGRIIGLACLRDDWLMQLHVDPAWQNRGIGSALLEYVKAERPNGFQLWTFQANVSARRFYERHACTAVEYTDGSGNEEKLPDVRYQWRAL